MQRLVVSYAYYRDGHVPLSLAAPEGRAAGKDLANFATGGVTCTAVTLQQASDR